MYISRVATTVGEAVSSFSFSFPFEGFNEVFVTKSGKAVVVRSSLGSSTTVLKSIQPTVTRPFADHLQSGLASGFFLKEVGSSSSPPSSPPKLRSFVSLESEVKRGAET